MNRFLVKMKNLMHRAEPFSIFILKENVMIVRRILSSISVSALVTKTYHCHETWQLFLYYYILNALCAVLMQECFNITVHKIKGVLLMLVKKVLQLLFCGAFSKIANYNNYKWTNINLS